MADAPHAPDATLGVFDTLLVSGGLPVDLRAHVERVARSARELYGVLVEPAWLAGRITDQVEGLRTARVRTTYHPGDPGEGWTVEATGIAEPGLEPRTLVVRRLPRGLGEHKWVDRRLVEGPHGADDVLLVDEADRVLECGTASLLMVVAGTLVTPPLDGRILPGTVRARVVAAARADGRRVVERPLARSELTGADEVLATSSVRGVQPVMACAGVGTWVVGPVTLRLRGLLADRS